MTRDRGEVGALKNEELIMNNCGIFQFCELKNEIQIVAKRYFFQDLFASGWGADPSAPVCALGHLPLTGEVFGRPVASPAAGTNELTRGVMNWLCHDFSLRSMI